MTLSEKDGQLFYKLWLPLLDYVNKKYKVNRKLKNIAGAEQLDPREVKEVANKLWEEVSLIDQYLSDCKDKLPDEHKEIIASWKNCVQGRFVMERHLKKGTIFISADDEKVYQVQGIISSWKEMFQFAPMPLLLEATFIPFRDVIISDGIVMPYNIAIGKNMTKQFKDIYMDAKKDGRIIRSLDATENRAIEEKEMENKKWKKFGKLTDKCYSNMIGTEKDGSCWKQAFELLKEIILEERQKNPNYAARLEMIDEVTDYGYDVQGWLEDCIDEIDIREEYEELLKMCDDLLEMFDWSEYMGSEIKFRKSFALKELGRKDEAAKYCKKWIAKEPENIVAAVAGVYAFIDTKEFDEAEKLVDRFITDRSECSDENDIMFTAASKLYEAMGKKKEKKQIDKAIEKYDDYLEEYFLGGDMDDEFDLEDDEFPFG